MRSITGSHSLRGTSLTTPDTFLADWTGAEIDWARPTGAPIALKTQIVAIGAGADALEVALATTIAETTAPKADEVRALWKVRWNRRAAPVVLVVAHCDGDTWRASVCGTQGDPSPIPNLPLDQVERICIAALSAPDPTNAERTVHRLLAGQKDALVAGLTNVGLFASHELRTGVPTRPDFTIARAAATPLLTVRGQDLIRGLGFSMTPHGSTASILSANGANRAVAVLLDENEVFDRATDRFHATSPVASGMAIAAARNLPWLIVTRGTQIRLYPTSPDVGVGRKGQAETYTEVDLALLAAADAAYLHLIFSAEALAENGTASQILAASIDHAAALGARLRTRVYEDVVPALAIAVANEMGASTEEDLAEAYHRTLTVLFRLLFVAYAEDRGLLPYQRNPRYTRKALKTLAREFTTSADLTFDGQATDRWEDLLAVWKAVDDGNTEWDVPAYNGGLFAADEHHPTGNAIAAMTLTNAEIGPALRALLIDTGGDGTLGPVDFRSLSVREFGTIYEGLLESSLSIAPTDLTIDRRTSSYMPAGAGDDVAAAAGQVYFHNASGARKATGSYFTKKFAVEHLLDTALEPALDDHLASVLNHLDSGDDAAASEAFFDFRIADLAMGSGHFLVAAIDRIENRLSAFLAEHPIANVTAELDRLAQSARAALGPNSVDIEIEPSALLRRQIARRCIYGLDLNLMAVELARLGIWIHTWVPGLPMSALDHGLRHGNSLTGIGTIDEVLSALEPTRNPGQRSLFAEQIEGALNTAKDRLLRVARTVEATKAEVHQASRAHAKAMQEAADAKSLMDAAIAVRLGLIPLPAGPDEAMRAAARGDVQAKIHELGAAHMPYLFPEVFMRDRAGFDVLIGNPPWEKVKVEEHQFWAVRSPGLRGLSRVDQETEMARLRAARPDMVAELDAEVDRVQAIKAALATGDYPGIKQGDTDLYKAFCWRNWNLLRDGGRVGFVLPRSAFTSSSASLWRLRVIEQGEFEDVALLMNTGTWVFDDVHQQYAFGLTTVRKGKGATDVNVAGPFASLREFEVGRGSKTSFTVDEFTSFTSGAAFPFLPAVGSAAVFKKLHAGGARLDDTKEPLGLRPLRELHATDDKDLFLSAPAEGGDRMPVFTGVSLDLWNGDTGIYYAEASKAAVTQRLYDKRLRQVGNSRSAFHGFPAQWVEDRTTLGCMSPRVAFRDVTNQENSRTTLVALVPGGVTLVHQAPYLLLHPDADRLNEAYVLGVLSSIPLDWYSRRVVERHLTMDLLNSFPVPRPAEDSPLRHRVIKIAGLLAAVDDRYADWAAGIGVPVGSVTDEGARNNLIAELDAVVSLLYGLDRQDVQHIYQTFHKGWAYQDRLDVVLTHYDAWKTKVTA